MSTVEMNWNLHGLAYNRMILSTVVVTWCNLGVVTNSYRRESRVSKSAVVRTHK